MMIVLVVNALYFIIFNRLIKIRRLKIEILRKWRKEIYWMRDTKIFKIFLYVLLFIEGTLLVYILVSCNIYWIMLLILGQISSSVTAILLSIKLQKEFK